MSDLVVNSEDRGSYNVAHMHDSMLSSLFQFLYSVLSQWYDRGESPGRLLPLFRRTGPGSIQCCEMFSLYQRLRQHNHWVQPGLFVLSTLLTNEKKTRTNMDSTTVLYFSALLPIRPRKLVLLIVSLKMQH